MSQNMLCNTIKTERSHLTEISLIKLICLKTGSGTNWKIFEQAKRENLGQGDKPDYFTSKATVIFMKKDNCMYKVGWRHL